MEIAEGRNHKERERREPNAVAIIMVGAALLGAWIGFDGEERTARANEARSEALEHVTTWTASMRRHLKEVGSENADRRLSGTRRLERDIELAAQRGVSPGGRLALRELRTHMSYVSEQVRDGKPETTVTQGELDQISRVIDTIDAKAKNEHGERTHKVMQATIAGALLGLILSGTAIFLCVRLYVVYQVDRGPMGGRKIREEHTSQGRE